MAGLCNLPDSSVVEKRQRRAEGRFMRGEAWHYALCGACDAPWTAECGGKSLNLIVRLAEPRGAMAAGRENRQDMEAASGVEFSSVWNTRRQKKKTCFVPKYLTGKVSFLSGSTIQRSQLLSVDHLILSHAEAQHTAYYALAMCACWLQLLITTTERADKATSMGRKWTRMIGCANLYPRFILGSLVFQGWECWDRILQCSQMLLRRACCLDLLYTPGSN